MNATTRVRRFLSRNRQLWRFVITAGAVMLAGIGYSAARAATAQNVVREEAAGEVPTVVTPSVHSRRVIACYFHTTYRCASCRAIEPYSRAGRTRAPATRPAIMRGQACSGSGGST